MFGNSGVSCILICLLLRLESKLVRTNPRCLCVFLVGIYLISLINWTPAPPLSFHKLCLCSCSTSKAVGHVAGVQGGLWIEKNNSEGPLGAQNWFTVFKALIDWEFFPTSFLTQGAFEAIKLINADNPRILKFNFLLSHKRIFVKISVLNLIKNGSRYFQVKTFFGSCSNTYNDALQTFSIFGASKQLSVKF